MIALPASAALAQTPAPDKDASRAHFDKAVVLQNEGSWDPALAEYRESLALYPTRAATKNAAICLLLLLRYDEALEMFKRLRDLPNLPDNDRALATQNIARLEGLLGAVELLDGPAGARVTIDSRDRGTLPLTGPLQVTAGTHVVRVYKDGFFPLERRVDVAGGTVKRLSAELPALTTSGQLKIVEANGKKLRVVVDNIVVGETPWEARLDVGAHAVWLQGAGKLGTVPTSTWVKRDRDTVLTLSASDLAGSLRVEPTPEGATVLIDSVEVGHGVWEGRLPPGAHRVDVLAEGFSYETRTALLEGEARQVLAIRLSPGTRAWEPQEGGPAVAPTWIRRLRIDAAVGFAGELPVADPVGPPCRGRCEQSSLAGGTGMLNAGYQLTPPLWLGVAAGFLALDGHRSETATGLLVPVGRPISADAGTTEDTLSLSGALLGAFAAFRSEGRLCVSGRIGAGFLVGAMVDKRSGFFTDSTVLRYPTGAATESASLAYVYLSPEIGVAMRLTEHMEINGGVGAFFLGALSRPRWRGDRQVFAGNDGVGHYRDEPLLGGHFSLIAPTIGASYRF